MKVICLCLRVRVRVGIRPVDICGQLAQFSIFALRILIEHASSLIRAAVPLDDVMGCFRGSIRYLFATIDPLPRSFKTAIYGTFVRRMRKDVRYCFDKNHDERLESKLEQRFLFAIYSRCTKLSQAIIFVLNSYRNFLLSCGNAS